MPYVAHGTHALTVAFVVAGAIAGIVDQPMQNFQRTAEAHASAGHRAKGVISGMGKGIMGVFTKPIGGAAELVSRTGYGKLVASQPIRPARSDKVITLSRFRVELHS